MNMTETMVTLRIKKDETVTQKQVEIEEIDGHQLEAILNLLRETLKLVETEPALKEIFDQMADDNLKKNKQKKANKAAGIIDPELEKDKDFVSLVVNGFDLLLLHIPSRAFDLLSMISGIERDLLMSQKYSRIMDILDASLEVNDLEKLYKRGKLSLGGLVAKLKLKEKAQQALNLTKR